METLPPREIMISTGIIFYIEGKEGLWEGWCGGGVMWLGGSEEIKISKSGQDYNVRGVVGAIS